MADKNESLRPVYLLAIANGEQPRNQKKSVRP
jgi:hypothetical protein